MRALASEYLRSCFVDNGLFKDNAHLILFLKVWSETHHKNIIGNFTNFIDIWKILVDRTIFLLKLQHIFLKSWSFQCFSFLPGYEDNDGNAGTAISGKRPKKAKKNKRQQRTVTQNPATDEIVLYNSSSVADKEVFASGKFLTK